jgi:hypothetical protein
MTENDSRAGAGMPAAQHPAAEAVAAMEGFLKAFSGFRGEVKQALKQQEERLTMLNWTYPTARLLEPICGRATTMGCAAWCWKARRCPPRLRLTAVI